MIILGNMQFLSSCSRVLTSLRYQYGYCGCRGSQWYHYWRCAMLKLVFVAPKTASSSNKWKKRSINVKSHFAKNTFLFLRVHEWTLFWGSIRIWKIVWGRYARQKNFWSFCSQLRFEILEIFSYTLCKIFCKFQRTPPLIEPNPSLVKLTEILYTYTGNLWHFKQKTFLQNIFSMHSFPDEN